MSFNFYKTTIGEQVTLQRGFDITKKDQVEGNIPVVSSGGISSYHNEAKVSGPGVVLGRKGSLGTVFYIDGPYWPHDTTLWVKDFKNNNPIFVYYFFKNISGLLKGMDVGAANPALNRNHVHPLEVLWPNRKTQDHIAGILASLDAKINNNTKVNKTLEQMAQALFKSWFVDFEPVKAKIAVLEAGGSQEEATLAAMTVISGKNADALKAFERENPEQCAELKATAELFPSAMQESELGKIPAGWSIKPLDEIAVYQNGLALQKFRPEDESNFLPVVKIAQLKKGFADGEEKASPNIKPECIIDNGDVIFSWSGSLMVDIWCGGKAALNQHLFKVSSTNYPKWIYYKYTTHHLNEFQRIAEAKAVTMGHIKREHLSQAKCVIPPSDTISAFTPFFEPLLNKIISNRLECKQFDKIRNNLLPKLLSGEIALPEAEEIAKEADYV
ncbi:restriction endonuclease subunit S [Citrobacter farmeri]